MVTPNTNGSLRLKLLRLILGALLLLGGATLLSSGALIYSTDREVQAKREEELLGSLEEKARLLGFNQALALRSLVADNLFGDVKALIFQTVSENNDIAYGLFFDAENRVWAASGLGQAAGPKDAPALTAKDLQALGISTEHHPRSVLRRRQNPMGGSDILEVAAPVVTEGTHAGTVIYGISTKSVVERMVQARELARSRLVTTLGLIGALILGSVAASYFLVKRVAVHITEPLFALRSAAGAIANGLRSSAPPSQTTGIEPKQWERVQIKSGDELELLGEAFNSMVEANEQAFDELRVKTEQALEASRLKSEFLANMSHEIRTPMNGILGVIRLMQNQPLDGKMRRYVETVDASANTLMAIINDVLDFSKLEAGKYVAQHVSYDLRLVVQEVAELMASQAHEKGLELVYRVERRVPTGVVGDPDRFRQVLTNLVGNAIKFTDRGEVLVDVAAPQQDKSSALVKVAVVDTGPGIAADDQKKLFAAFTQVDGSMVRNHGGTGLGLAISKHLVEVMGGEIGIDSTPGQGSRFWFTIKVGVTAGGEQIRSAEWASGRRALVVEISKSWRDVVVEHLVAWGFDAEATTSGRDAISRLELSLLEKRPFSAAVVGVQMDDLDLEAFLRTIQSVPGLERLPVVALYHMGSSVALTGLESTLVTQLPKPLRVSELYNTLQSALTGAKIAPVSKPGVEPGKIASKLPVLVVDDNEINRYVAMEQVEQLGLRVETACNGLEALECIKQKRYVAVLMDCQMPVMDGYTATQKIREWEREKNRHTVIIALTAHALVGERDRVLAAGMDDYLAKPVRPQSLQKTLWRHVVLHRDEPETAPALTSGAREPASLLVLDPEVPRSRKLIELVLKNVPQQLDGLEASLRASVVAEVKASAHKLKGSMLSIGASRVAELAEKMQFAAGQGELPATGDLARIREEFASVSVALKEELAATAQAT
ncbi:hybrid sensor histidine kinase/response regulator [Sorangium cellulosum]|uniref:Sensory/regulatory protein RpfC n=1 Tax=Sorangium cellulosum TaxID=56 RepID=A0A150R0W5_SORCE|nr:hybrid sensor histidine kinase/response regulator [Sorangium cellulosum]KYF73771.1 histidine kinase [Sorangium cellulosum]